MSRSETTTARGNKIGAITNNASRTPHCHLTSTAVTRDPLAIMLPDDERRDILCYESASKLTVGSYAADHEPL